MASYELSRSSVRQMDPGFSGNLGLGTAMLLYNTHWFLKIRWAVIAMLAAFGMTSCLLPEIFRSLGLIPVVRWPLLLAAILAVCNILFLLMARGLKPDSDRKVLSTNIWLQIILDLSVLTVMVHMMGSTDTFMPFAYLFHIVLACVFFGTIESFSVVCLAAAFYLGNVLLEFTGVTAARSIFSGQAHHPCAQDAILAVSAVFVWFIVWYLVSNISRAVRRRDQLLEKADHEMNMQVLRTTHDLKAPFAGIESSIQILKHSHYADLPQPARETIEKIQARSETLRMRIDDILMLGELRAADKSQIVFENIRIDELIREVIAELDAKAKQRRINVAFGMPPAEIKSQRKMLFVMFSNLIANAISYSHGGGNIEISGTVMSGKLTVSVKDRGIGIKAAALPRIFDEYFRTAEALEFNPMSTGLGLSIVKNIVQNLGFDLSVESEEGKGTKFDVTMTLT